MPSSTAGVTLPRTTGVRQNIQFTLLEMSAQVLCKQTQEPLVSGTETFPAFVSSCCTNQRVLKSSLGIAACCRSLLVPFALSSDPFENTSSILVVLVGSRSQSQHHAPLSRAVVLCHVDLPAPRHASSPS